MARYEHLPLYKNAYDFKLYLVKLSRGFPKDFKYGLALEMRKLSSEVIDNIILANNHKEKTEYLDLVLMAIERMKVKARLLKDLAVIKTESYKYISKSLVEISKQTIAWKNWAVREQ